MKKYSLKIFPIVSAAFIIFVLICACKEKPLADNSSTVSASQPQKKNAPAAPSKFVLTDDDKNMLIKIARETLDKWVKERISPDFKLPEGVLMKKGAAFVTLRINGSLRGCIGHTIAQIPLWRCVRDMAIASAANDTRFSPVQPDELPRIKIEISVLTPPERVTNLDEIKMGRDGVIVRNGYNSGVFLPQVATETGWDKVTFLSHLCNDKASLPPNCYEDPQTEVFRFEAIVFEEKE